jgi:prepilin-type N-terminal cleavage/methylation domain-containing protein
VKTLAPSVVRPGISRPVAGPRSAFTLVELLMVIGIIALLAALVTPAVMRSMSTARAAAVKTEIELLHLALMNYKQEYGAFPPADMKNLWDTTASPAQVNRLHPAYKHLKRCFPQLSEFERNDLPNSGNFSPYYFMAQMSPSQALVFWLQGFYDNAQRPLTNGGALAANTPRTGDANGSRRKLFDFDDKRLYAASPYFQPVANAQHGNPQTFASRNNANAFDRDYPVYFPNIPNAGVPYVYFPNSSYSAVTGPVTAAISAFGGTPPVFYYHAVSSVGDTTYVSPYFNSTPPPQPTFAQLHQNPDSFQLISAGLDGSYAAANTKPACFPQGLSTTFNSQTIGPLPAVTDASQAAGNQDNITNFANGPLRAAAEKLLAQ